MSAPVEVTASCLHERYYTVTQGGRPKFFCRDCGAELVEVEDETHAAVESPPELRVVSAPNLDQARAYLEALTGEKNPAVTFQTFTDTSPKPTPDPLAAWLHGTLDQHVAELTRLNELGAGIFNMVNKGDGRGRSAKNVTRIRALYADRDRPGARPPALAPSFSVTTSPGKKHDYLLVAGAMPLEDFKPSQEALADYCGSDRSVNDLPRVARLPGFYHRKKTPVLVTFEPGSGRSYTPDEIRAAHPAKPKAPPPPKPKTNTPRPATGSRRENLMQIVREKAEGRDWAEGHRHASAKETAAHGRKLWLEAEELASIVVDFAEGSGLSREEADGIVTWAMANVTPDPDEAERSPAPKASTPASLPLAGEEIPWPERQPLPPEAESVPTLGDELLPEALRPWLADVAERVSIPLEFVAAPALVALGSAVGRSCAIRPMARDDWQEVPNLWGGIVGPPGVMKSAAIAEAMRPVSRLAREAARAFEEAERGRDATLEVTKARRDAARDTMRQAAKKSDAATLEAKRKEMADLAAEEERGKVTERRYVTSDATIEKLGALLNTNPRGLLLTRDELTGWLRGLDREDRAEARAFFLEAWNGNGRFTVDRIGRGTVHVEGLCVSVLGGIQPGPLRPYVLGSIAGEEGNDGLIQRFGLLVWPDAFGEWKAVDRWPDREARERAFAVFSKLATFDPLSIGAEIEDENGLPFFRFDAGAQGLFLEWRYELEHRLRSDEMSAAPAFTSHVAKYRKLVPALALLFHLTEAVDGGAGGTATERALRLALSWADFLEAHARKLYSAELRPGVAAAHALGTRIEAGDVQDGMTVRDIARREWSGLRTSGRVLEAATELGRLGWLRVEATPSADDLGRGRPSDVIRLHPDLRRPK